MTAAATFTVDPAGVRALLSGPPAVSHLTDRAHAIQTEAERIAPGGFGGYKASLSVGPAVTRDGVAAVEVRSSSSFWHLVEYGSVNNVPHRVMERAVRASGLDYVPL